jgi:CRP-like cAMP-binding protein
LIGVQDVLDGQPATATVTAIDDVEVRVLHSGEFRALLSVDPELAIVLLRVLAVWLRRAIEDRVTLAMHDSIGRVALRLVQLAHRYGVSDNGRVRILLPISQGELAAWTGLSREATSKALHVLRKRDVIRTQRKEIQIVNIEALHERLTGNATVFISRA